MRLYKHLASSSTEKISKNLSLRATQVHHLNDCNELYPDPINDLEIVSREIKLIYNYIVSIELDSTLTCDDIRSDSAGCIFSIINKSMMEIYNISNKCENNNLLLLNNAIKNNKLSFSWIREEEEKEKNRTNKYGDITLAIRNTFNTDISESRAKMILDIIKCAPTKNPEEFSRYLNKFIYVRDAAKSVAGNKYLVVSFSKSKNNAKHFVESGYSLKPYNKKESRLNGIDGSVLWRDVSSDRNNVYEKILDIEASNDTRMIAGVVLSLESRDRYGEGISLVDVTYLENNMNIEYVTEDSIDDKIIKRLSSKQNIGTNRDNGDIVVWSDECEARLIIRSSSKAIKRNGPIAVIHIKEIIPYDYYMSQGMAPDFIDVISYDQIPETSNIHMEFSHYYKSLILSSVGKPGGICFEQVMHKEEIYRIDDIINRPCDIIRDKLCRLNIPDEIYYCNRDGVYIMDCINSQVMGKIADIRIKISRKEAEEIFEMLHSIESNHSNYFSKKGQYNANKIINLFIDNELISASIGAVANTDHERLVDKFMSLVGSRSSTNCKSDMDSFASINYLDDIEMFMAVDIINKSEVCSRDSLCEKLASILLLRYAKIGVKLNYKWYSELMTISPIFSPIYLMSAIDPKSNSKPLINHGKYNGEIQINTERVICNGYTFKNYCESLGFEYCYSDNMKKTEYGRIGSEFAIIFTHGSLVHFIAPSELEIMTSNENYDKLQGNNSSIICDFNNN